MRVVHQNPYEDSPSHRFNARRTNISVLSKPKQFHQSGSAKQSSNDNALNIPDLGPLQIIHEVDWGNNDSTSNECQSNHFSIRSHSEHLSCPLGCNNAPKTAPISQQQLPQLNTVEALKQIDQFHWIRESDLDFQTFGSYHLALCSGLCPIQGRTEDNKVIIMPNWNAAKEELSTTDFVHVINDKCMKCDKDSRKRGEYCHHTILNHLVKHGNLSRLWFQVKLKTQQTYICANSRQNAKI